MNFNTHSDLIGQHAFLSASKYHWINYDEEKLVESYSNFRAAQLGTERHAFACQAIRLGIPLRGRDTLALYVNDAIGFKMTPEQVLFYSYNCFGTADTVAYRKKFLRIHDYKSGAVPAHMEQLLVYEALFCLEYKLKPTDFESELRIYQNDDIMAESPHHDDVEAVMQKIIAFDKKIELLKLEV